MKIKQKITEEVKLRTTILKKLMVTKSKSVQKNMLNKLVNKFGISKRYARILLEVDSLGDNTKNNYIKKNGIEYEQTASLDEVLGKLDIIYMTRVQRERFFNEEDYLRLKDSYILTPEKMKAAKQDMIIMHPLPRVNEISTAVDADCRACYFKQAKYGKFIRMALILKLLEVE